MITSVLKFTLLVSGVLWCMSSQAALRSFTTMPINKGDTVVRFVAINNSDTDTDMLVSALAHGVNGNQALFFNVPYRVSPAGDNRTGDLGVLYRYTFWKQDKKINTRRAGLLVGAILPTDHKREEFLQLGVVTSFRHGRNNWDINLLWQDGLGDAPDRARFDVSWQYRLSPKKFPKWGAAHEWDAIVELRSNWKDGADTVNQLTLGIQHIRYRWVFEGGVIEDLNGPEHRRYMLGVRFRF